MNLIIRRIIGYGDQFQLVNDFLRSSCPLYGFSESIVTIYDNLWLKCTCNWVFWTFILLLFLRTWKQKQEHQKTAMKFNFTHLKKLLGDIAPYNYQSKLRMNLIILLHAKLHNKGLFFWTMCIYLKVIILFNTLKRIKRIVFEIIICTFALEQNIRFHATNFPVLT